jgi:hypothetical protein
VHRHLIYTDPSPTFTIGARTLTLEVPRGVRIYDSPIGPRRLSGCAGLGWSQSNSVLSFVVSTAGPAGRRCYYRYLLVLAGLLSLTYLPHVLLQKCFPSPSRLFATYERDVSIYESWNALDSPCARYTEWCVPTRRAQSKRDRALVGTALRFILRPDSKQEQVATYT